MTTNPRDPAFMEAILQCFAENDVEGEGDLIGLIIENLVGAPRGARHSYIHRAIVQANVNAVSPLLPPAAQASDSMSTLMKALKKECPKVHVDVAARNSNTTLEGFPQSCCPPGVLTDSLASEAAQKV